MARQIDRLAAKTVAMAHKPGMYPDGNGLYLRVAPGGSKSWLLRYRHGGKRHDHGLGPYPLIGLADARQRANQRRRLLLDGIDPLARRRAQVAAEAAQGMKLRTVAKCVEECIQAREGGWKGNRQAADWRSRFANYVLPVIGDLTVDVIDTPQVRAVLDPIWNKRPVMAGRVRERLAKVLDFAAVNGYREAGPNPARWRGHLDQVYPKRSAVRPVQRHAALPYNETAGFMAALRDRDGIDARALEFLILTAVRTSEVLLMQWDELELAARVWNVPAAHRKATKDRATDHRVPLSDAAVAILEGLPRVDDFVFPGMKGAMTRTALFALLRKMKRPDLTAHGFRSTFRTWAGERTAFPAKSPSRLWATLSATRPSAPTRAPICLISADSL